MPLSLIDDFAAGSEELEEEEILDHFVQLHWADEDDHSAFVNRVLTAN